MTTTYNVDTVYSVKGNAASGLKNIEAQASRSAAALKNVDQGTKQVSAGLSGLRSVMGMALGGGLIAGGYKAFIGFNSEMQKLKIGLTTVLSMGFHIPFERAKKESDALFATFQKMSAESPATTKDFVEMANSISGAVLAAGMGTKDLAEMTKGAIIASSALGVESGMLARDVGQMLRGNVTAVDPFAERLLSGVGETDMKKFNAKSDKERAVIVKAALDQPSLKAAAKEFENSWDGATSTLKDNLQLALGDAGGGLMKSLTEEVQKWNTWIVANPAKIKEITTSMANGLKEAFYLIKDIGVAMLPILKGVFEVIGSVMRFVSEHRDTLIGVVKAMAVYKGVSMAGGIASGLGKSGLGFIENLMAVGQKTAASGAGGLLSALPSIAGQFAKVVPGLALFGIAIGAVTSLLTRETESAKKARATAEGQVLAAKSVADARLAAERSSTNMIMAGVNPDTGKLWGDDRSLMAGDRLIGEKERYDKAQADIKATREDLINRGREIGAIKETFDPKSGRRTMSLTTPDAMPEVSGDNMATKIGSELSKISGGRPDQISLLKKQFIDRARGQLMGELGDMFKENIRKSNAMFGGPGKTQDWFQSGGQDGVYGFYTEQYMAPAPAEDKNALKGGKATDVNVTISKIEVYSDDPDRFVHAAVGAFEEIAKNPTQARDALRGL